MGASKNVAVIDKRQFSDASGARVLCDFIPLRPYMRRAGKLHSADRDIAVESFSTFFL